jgi:uncharacterized protein (DUF983 family)
MSSAKLSRFQAILRQRCPRCLDGRIFRGSVTMNPACPACGLVFEREPGYFLGAMYISYALSIGVLGILMLIGHLLWPELDLGLVVLLAAVVYLPLVPMVFRYSRVIWIHFDRWAWPGSDSGKP